MNLKFEDRDAELIFDVYKQVKEFNTINRLLLISKSQVAINLFEFFLAWIMQKYNLRKIESFIQHFYLKIIAQFSFNFHIILNKP